METYERAQRLWESLNDVSTRIAALDISTFDEEDRQTIATTGASCLGFAQTLLKLDAHESSEQESNAFFGIAEDFCAASRTMLVFAERSIYVRRSKKAQQAGA